MRNSVLAAALVLGAPALAQFEAIDPTYRNLRGFNYIATYSDIDTALGSADHPLADVASAPSMWFGFDPTGPSGAEVQAQLQRIKDIGANSIRVWLSYHYYHFAPQQMKTKFGAFLDMCDAIGLHVMPILWDNDFVEPDYSSLEGADYHNFAKWVRSPGQSVIQNLQGALDATMTAYVQDMVGTGKVHPSLLIWNVMNEPQFEHLTTGGTNGQHTFVLNTLALIKGLDASAKTCVSPPIWIMGGPDAPLYEIVANSPHLDALGTHFYGQLRADVEGVCLNASKASVGYKPVIVTECGYVGYGATYDSILNLVRGVPATFTHHPNNQAGVGFYLFEAYVGNAAIGPGHPYLLQEGLLYNPVFDQAGTGFTRDYTATSAVGALIALAATHGVTVAPPNLTPMPTGNPAYVPGLPMLDGFDRHAITLLMTGPPMPMNNGFEMAFVGELLSGFSVHSFSRFPLFLTDAASLINPSEIEAMGAIYVKFQTWMRNTPFTYDPILRDDLSMWWQIAAPYWLQLHPLYP
ncbi:MAG: hypothetical protein IT457_17605 [Planctomycetes bacterium]|nr:hypothetical protein [Planctomycetota bacterium]